MQSRNLHSWTWLSSSVLCGRDVYLSAEEGAVHIHCRLKARWLSFNIVKNVKERFRDNHKTLTNHAIAHCSIVDKIIILQTGWKRMWKTTSCSMSRLQLKPPCQTLQKTDTAKNKIPHSSRQSIHSWNLCCYCMWCRACLFLFLFRFSLAFACISCFTLFVSRSNRDFYTKQFRCFVQNNSRKIISQYLLG